MSSSFVNYDSWLERPFQDAQEESDRFYDWCETHNIDSDDPNAESAYMDWIDSQWEPPEDDWDEDPDDFDIERDVYDD